VNLTTRVARAMIDSCVDESLRVKPNKGLGITKGTIKLARYQIAGLCPMMEGVDGEEFFFEDLRGGYRESIRMSRELGLYRQKYCGCLYSEWERYGTLAGEDAVPSRASPDATPFIATPL